MARKCLSDILKLAGLLHRPGNHHLLRAARGIFNDRTGSPVDDLPAEQGQLAFQVLDLARGDRVEVLVPDGDVRILADLVVLNSNPLDDLRNSADIQYVMKGGALYDGDTLNQVWPESIPKLVETLHGS